MTFALVRLNSAGIEEVLKSSEVRSAIDGYALEIGVAVEGSDEVVRNGVSVDVDSYTTDRAAAAVTMTHPAGIPIEAKYGTLIREAGASGLEVKSYGT